MKFYDDLLNSLFTSSELIQEKETDVIFEATFTSKGYNNATISHDVISFLQTRDSLHLSVSFGDGEPITFKSGSLSDFKTELDKEAIHIDDELITFSLIINKSTVDEQCTIYEFNLFIDTLTKLNSAQFLNIFSRLFESSSRIKFKVFNLSTIIYTDTISFSGLEDSFDFEAPNKRNEKFENFKSLCHYSNIDKLKMIPADFKLISSDGGFPNLSLQFNKFAVILSIIYLFDISSLQDNELAYKINGYKAIKGSVNTLELDLKKLNEYYDIYDWVYNGGNLNDKIGLARNIITLHFVEKEKLDLQGHPFQSIQSSYKVYEKQNIKQYIEIRNKISDQLLEFNNRANKIIETFASGFQKSALALISFYISAIVLRVLGKGEFFGIFSLDATFLSFAFISGSLIYYWVSRWEINEQRKRFVSSYENLKLRYTDLLEEEDIRRILNNDKEFNEDVEFIDSKKKIYSRMWIAILVILGATTLFLFLCYNLTQVFDTWLFKIIFKKSCNCE